MEHLVCFVPGMLALGHYHGAGFRGGAGDGGNIGGEKELEDMNDLELAIELLHTCVDLYLDQTTGLGPESVRFFEIPSRQGKLKLKNKV
jgi:endoplasmic reticulum Man9GlcNAc2 1,2-alpha-mannosidase